jgi:glycosyltransferase involved in cell wall biosynthesis
MRIAMFTDAYWPRVNGVTVAVDTYAKALLQRGHDVMIVCAQYPDSYTYGRIEGEESTDCRERPVILRVSSHSFPFSKEDRMAKSSKWRFVAKNVARFKPDIVHVHSEFMMCLFGSLYAKRFKVPFIYTFHTLWETYIPNYSFMAPYIPLIFPQLLINGIRKAIFRSADVITAPTKEIIELLHRKWKVKHPTFLLPTGFDKRLFAHTSTEATAFRRNLDKQYPQLADKRLLLFVGRIAGEKNLLFLINLMPAILEKHPEVALVLVGNGPTFYEYQQKVDEMGLYESVVFTDYLSRKTVSLMYAVSTLFVFPSLTETQGLVTIEAMLSGLPVVAIGAMGTINVMAGDNGGFMVHNNADEFKQRVFDLLEDADLYAHKVAQARAHAEKWTIEPFAAQLEKIYRDALSSAYNVLC